MKLRIIKIVNEYLVVVNYGSTDGASLGQKLEIFDEGEEIIDPETNKSMGTLDVIKARIKIENVYEHMSLCESHETVSLGGFSNITNAFNRTEIKALNVDSKDISGGYNKTSKIKVGDFVRLAPSSEEDNLTY